MTATELLEQIVLVYDRESPYNVLDEVDRNMQLNMLIDQAKDLLAHSPEPKPKYRESYIWEDPTYKED